MLTARDAPTDQIRGLDTGADDYVVKPFVFEVLLARIRALLRRRDSADGPEILRYADLTLDAGSRLAKRGDREIDLTTTEYELLRLFLQNPERVLTRGVLMAGSGATTSRAASTSSRSTSAISAPSSRPWASHVLSRRFGAPATCRATGSSGRRLF